MLSNSIGMMGETVALGWLTLELTNSPFLVGVAMSARSLPLFFVGVPAGVIADRLPRHRLLIATSVGQAITSGTIGLLVLSELVTLPFILTITFAAGMIRGVEQAARQSYTHDVVGAVKLMDGFAVLGVAMRAGWLLGSLITGTVIAHFGAGAAYIAVSIAYASAAIAILPAAAPETSAPPGGGSVWQSLTGFLTAIRRDRALSALMILTAGAEVLGFSHQAVLPSLARDVLHVGPEGLGVMSAARSVGGILGIFGVSSIGLAAGGGTLFLTVLLSFGAAIVGLALAPHLVGFGGVIVLLIAVNAAGALSDLLAQSLMQLSVPANLRGRAGGAWVVAIGLAPLGQLQIGAMASLFGASIALGTSGLALVALATVAALAFPRVRRL